MPTAQTILYALLGGILPALVWLWFWLRQDCLKPEPRRLIIRTFMLGMLAVPVVIPLERWIIAIIPLTTFVLILWAILEELLKLAAAYIGGLRSKFFDEPVDALIYLITAALGFAALENVLFLIGPIKDSGVLLGLLTGNIRFVGATLLHVISSGAIGFFLALSFHKRKAVKSVVTITGVILAIILHTLFNFFILQYSTSETLFPVFASVWVLAIVLMLAFEKIKRLRK